MAAQPPMRRPKTQKFVAGKGSLNVILKAAKPHNDCAATNVKAEGESLWPQMLLIDIKKQKFVAGNGSPNVIQ